MKFQIKKKEHVITYCHFSEARIVCFPVLISFKFILHVGRFVSRNCLVNCYSVHIDRRGMNKYPANHDFKIKLYP